MKKTRSTVFSKAKIVEVDSQLLIVESGKKDESDKVYSLTNELLTWADVEGISLSIKKDEEIDPEDIMDNDELFDEFIKD